jgi:hypothetical protein
MLALNECVNKDTWPVELESAKQYATDIINQFHAKKAKKASLLRAVVEATTVSRIQFIVINSIFSGNGLSVIK